MSWKFEKLESGQVSNCGTFIINEYQVNSFEDEHGWGYCDGVQDGFRLTTASYPNINIVDNQLFFSDREVSCYPVWCKRLPSMKGHLPAWYVIRVKSDDGFWSFCTGFDLISDGRVWCGHIREQVEGRFRITENGYAESYFENIEDAIKHIDKALDGVEWQFFMEEQQSL